MSTEQSNDAPLKVALGSPSRHWTFDLGRELNRLGLLDRVYTQYPKGRVDTVPASLVRSFPWVLGASFVLARLGWDGAWRTLDPLRMRTYDRWLARTIDPCTVFHCITGFGLRTHERVRREFGALAVCDRASAHILTQERILQDERERWGLQPDPIDPVVVARNLAEYEECDIVVVPSPFARRTFIEEGVPAEKVACVPFGADLRIFKPVPKEDDVFRVLYAGSISLEKGIPYLLEAVNSPRLPGCELWLVGPATDETEFILSRFPDGYRYFGPVPRTELSWYYSQASVLVLPSVQDGFGMVMAQAMACGVPVIATDHTGVDALFDDGEAGYHVPIRDPGAIREALLRLQSSPEERMVLATAARKKVEGLGGWRAYGEAMAAVYRRDANAPA